MNRIDLKNAIRSCVLMETFLPPARRLSKLCRVVLAMLFGIAAGEPAGAQTAQSESGKWLATADAKWQATYQRDIGAPFSAAVAELRKQYLASLNAPLAAATQAGRTDEAAVWSAERGHVSAGEPIPGAETAGAPAALKSLRTSYREQFARLDKQRFDRARALFAQCDAILTKNQTALLDKNRAAEAAELQKERDQLKTAWLQPPAAPSVIASAGRSPGAAAAKMSAQQIIEKLLGLGAGVWVKPGKGDPVEVKSSTQMAADKFTFYRVEFRPQRPDASALVAADYELLDSLGELVELSLSGENVTDAVVEKLRCERSLQSLALDQAKLTGTSYDLLSGFPDLRELRLSNTGANNDAMKALVQCRKLKSLHLAALPIGDEALATLGKVPALEELELSELDQLTSAGFAHLAEYRALKQFSAGGFTILTGMVEQLGHCKNLEIVALPGSGLKDADIAPLAALPKIRILDLEGSAVTGAAFASWPLRSQLISLNLTDAAGVDDAAFKSIEHAFPKLEELDVKAAGAGFSAAGAGVLNHLRNLHTLRISGSGLTDEVVAPLGRCEQLTLLAIPGAALKEQGIAALAKIPHLAELSIDAPPLSEPALKAFGRCKELKTVNIGKDAPAETEAKLQKALPGAVIRRG